MSPERRKTGTEAALDEMVEAWREGSGQAESLSERCRREILAAMTDGEALRSERPLFPRSNGLAWVFALPALLLALAIAWQLAPREGGAPLSEPVPRISAIRSGDDVIFVIANGKREHTVYRSESKVGLERAAEEAFAVTDGTFRDRLESQADLVFYRID